MATDGLNISAIAKTNTKKNIHTHTGSLPTHLHFSAMLAVFGVRVLLG